MCRVCSTHRGGGRGKNGRESLDRFSLLSLSLSLYLSMYLSLSLSIIDPYRNSFVSNSNLIHIQRDNWR